MQLNDQTLRTQQLARALIEGWWVILSFILIGNGVAYFYSYSQPNVYRTTATFVAMSKLRSSDPSDLINSQDTLAGRSTMVATYCNILDSRFMSETAAQALRVSAALLEQYNANCAVLPNSNVMQLTVEGPSPDLATDLANAIGDAGIEYISTTQEVYELRTLDAAALNLDPVSPDHITDLLLGVGISMLGGIALILLTGGLRVMFEDRLDTKSQGQ